MAAMSGGAEGMAWEAVHRDGDAIIPVGWYEISATERAAFRDELEEWMAKAKAQPHLFADRGVRARRLLELTEDH
jgi:hypothetical protein